MSARKQLLYPSDRTPKKNATNESSELLPATPERTSSTIIDDTQDDNDHLMSPTVTTVKRPRIAPTSSSASLLQESVVVGRQSQSQGTQHSRREVAALSDPSPAPKKPRVDQVLRNVLGSSATGGTARAPALPIISSSQKELLPAVTPQTAVRTTQPTQQQQQLSPPMSLTSGSEMSLFATPVATQLFEPDEPLTATQDAFVVDGFEMPSPPPFFGPAGGSEDRGSTPVGGSSSRRRAAQEDVKSTQECLVQWAESTKAFFNFIDRRNIIDVDD